LSVLRLFRYLPAKPNFDEILRTEMLPDLMASPGIEDWYLGRQGPDNTGPRIVATVWESRAAMVHAVGDRLGVFHPEHMDATTDQSLEIRELLLCLRPGGAHPKILRTLVGQTELAQLGAYVDDVARGVELDVAAGHGPTAFYIAGMDGDAFVTVSAWQSWSDIEEATGGDIHRPSATRRPERLRHWEVEHWEMVHGDPVAGAASVPVAFG